MGLQAVKTIAEKSESARNADECRRGRRILRERFTERALFALSG